MLRWMLALALACAPWTVAAQSEAEMRAQAQASMVVSGSLDFEPDGTVSAFSLDQKEKLPDFVVDIIGQAVTQWRFEPVVVDGVASPARVLVSLRVVAAPADDGALGISLANATFMYRDSDDESERLKLFLYLPPRYPSFAMDRNASGDVIMLLKINRKGRVVDSAVEQVNLRQIANARTVHLLRKFFSDSALYAVRHWIFKTPTTGPYGNDPFWTARVPISFLMEGTSTPDADGKWVGYVPGPRQAAPWLGKAAPDANDAAPSGSVQLVGSGPRLLTPLQPES